MSTTTTVRSTAATPIADNNKSNAVLDATPPLLQTDPSLALSALGITTSTSTTNTSEPYLAKPKAPSADARHECGSALLPITTTTTTTSNPHLGIVGSSPTMATWQLLLYYHQQLLFPPLVKDDVFLGPADNESVITVNSSTDSNSSSAGSTAPSVGNWAPTPCLSPVTSPSDFLCNHEPLFDGIEDLQQQQQKTLLDKDEQVNHNDDDHDDTQQEEQTVVEHESGYATQVKPDDHYHYHPASPNLDWYEFTKEDDGHTSSSVLAGLPTPSPTASENEASIFDEDEEADEDEDDQNKNNSIETFDNEPQISFEFFSSGDEDEDDDEDDELLELSYCAPVAPLLLPPPATFTSAATRSLKRKRSQSIDSITSYESEQEEEEEAEGNDAPVLQRLHRLRLSEPKQQRKNKSKPVAKRRTKRHPGRGRGVRPKTIACAAYDVQQQQQDDDDGVHRTIFERLTHAGIDWCRYCGTTEGVNWRPGPWGKRTLCNKHGCDYKGYGIASRLPRLDLSAFIHERLEDRRRPVVQQSCVVCQGSESSVDNKLVPCEGGCSRAYHQLCRIPAITSYQDQQWCCSTVCRENRKRNKVGPYDS